MRKIIILILIGINVIYVWSGATKFGAQSIDVYGNWLLKAKILYLNNGQIPELLLNNPDYKSAHWQYPYLWPLTVWQIYKYWGFNEQNIYNLFPLFYAVILVLAAINFRKSGISWIKVLILTYVYSMLGPLLAQGGRFHAGNADILILLLGWLIVSFRDKKLLVAVLVVIASMIKTEGVFWAVFLLNSKWIFLAVLPAIIWQAAIKKYNIPNDFGLMLPVGIVGRLWGLIRGMAGEFLNVNNWYILWPIFFLSVKKHPFWRPLLFMLSGFIFIYLGTNINTYAYVSSSFDRVLLQLSPLWFTMMSLWVSETLFRNWET